MKKITAFIFSLLLAVNTFGQIGNLPSTGPSVKAFKLNPLYLTYQFQDGVTIPTITAEVFVSNQKTSLIPSVSVSGRIVTVSLTAGQVGQMPASVKLYVKFGTVYRIAVLITPTMDSSVPSTVPFVVNLSDLGIIKINLIGDAAAAAQYAAQAKAAKDSAVSNQWTGKKILWVGTSIPWQFQPNSYPQRIAKLLGATVINRAISGSTIISFAPVSGVGGQLGLSGTAYEHQHYGPFSDANSYDRNIGDFLSQVDLVVIDHGHNDTPLLPDRLGTISSMDKGTLYGAFNWIINEILSTKPKMRIVLMSPPNLYQYGGEEPSVTNFKSLVTAVQDIADKWCFPYFKWSSVSGMNARAMTERILTTDGIHPSVFESDSILTPNGYRFILNVK